MSFGSYLRRPNAAASGYSARSVAAAYNAPIGSADGTGTTVAVIELGGAINAADLTAVGINPGNVTVMGVDGGKPVSDGPNGADGEVALDVEVIGLVAPGAKIICLFAPNTDQGFSDAIAQAVAAGVDAISISWGGPESQWTTAAVQAMESAMAGAKAKGIPVFVAAGDSGSRDGTRTNTTDYPASSPNAIGCGGTRLILSSSGARQAETVWNDNPTNDATGGGVSRLFPGRTIPDVAGCADPVTGYQVTVDGQSGVIGGTSAVAPLYAACYVVAKQVLGKSFDLVGTIQANPGVCFDVTQGNNGGYAAGPGKDDVSGWGVVDWGKLLTVLQGGSVPTPTPTPTPTPVPPSSGAIALLQKLQADCTLLADQANQVGATIGAFLSSNSGS